MVRGRLSGGAESSFISLRETEEWIWLGDDLSAERIWLGDDDDDAADDDDNDDEEDDDDEDDNGADSDDDNDDDVAAGSDNDAGSDGRIELGVLGVS